MPVKIKRPSGRPGALQLLIESALSGVAFDLIEWQEQRGRVATGTSKNWTVNIRRFGNTKPKEVAGSLVGVRYINYALFGRGAGRPPRVELILQWMRVRGIKGRDILSGRFRTNRDAAQAIAREIGRVGTKALRLSPILQDAIYSRNLNRAVVEFIPDIAEETLDSLTDGFIEAINDLDNVTLTIS